MSSAPIAKFGAMSTPRGPEPVCSCRPSRTRARRSSSHPVVPTTTLTPRARQRRTLSSEESGTLNSTTTSAPPRSPSSSPMSKRPTSSRSSAPVTASHTVDPIRPAAPITATRTVTATTLEPADAPGSARGAVGRGGHGSAARLKRVWEAAGKRSRVPLVVPDIPNVASTGALS